MSRSCTLSLCPHRLTAQVFSNTPRIASPKLNQLGHTLLNPQLDSRDLNLGLGLQLLRALLAGRITQLRRAAAGASQHPSYEQFIRDGVVSTTVDSKGLDVSTSEWDALTQQVQKLVSMAMAEPVSTRESLQRVDRVHVCRRMGCLVVDLTSRFESTMCEALQQTQICFYTPTHSTLLLRYSHCLNSKLIAINRYG